MVVADILFLYVCLFVTIILAVVMGFSISSLLEKKGKLSHGILLFLVSFLFVILMWSGFITTVAPKDKVYEITEEIGKETLEVTELTHDRVVIGEGTSRKELLLDEIEVIESDKTKVERIVLLNKNSFVFKGFYISVETTEYRVYLDKELYKAVQDKILYTKEATQ